jgi:tetratricopeptide (TPR) repeat protein
MPADVRPGIAGGAVAFVLSAGAIGCAEAPSGRAGADGYVGSAACVSCHPRESGLWAASDHARAMAVPDAAAPDGAGLLGDFGGADPRFLLRDGVPTVNTRGDDGAPAELPVAAVLGIDPLQQLVLELPDGGWRAFPVAWDARPDSAGGGRWFDLYGDDPPAPGDPLHWTGREQDAASRCVECHVTGLRAGIDPETFRARPTWAEGSVACEACHGPGSGHVQWAGLPEEKRGADPRLTFGVEGDRPAAWAMDAETGIARRDPPRTEHAELQTCAPCHSRRTPLTDPAPAGGRFEDGYRGALLEPGLYWPDGQVRDEVYEHASFLQSRMHAAGVTCSDCHDPHSGRTLGEGNGLCARCHLPARFDVPEHTLHAPGTAGAACVACHMPAAVFMGVDVRHDHSLRIPRPDLSPVTGAPDACAACHDDRPAGWAAAALRERFGPPEPHPFAETFRAAAEGAPEATAGLAAVAGDSSLSAIVRATAVSFLFGREGEAADAAVRAAAADPDPLVRRAAAEALESRSAVDRLKIGLPLASDPVRSVRAEIGRVLADLPASFVPAEGIAARDAAVEEYRESLRAQADRPEAHLAAGILETRRRDPDAARRAYGTALRIAPDFAPAAVNLADLLRDQGRETEAEEVLRAALDRADAADAHHALGLLLVRTGRRGEALRELARAAELHPESARYAYVHAVALIDAGRLGQARGVVDAAGKRFPRDPGLAELREYLDAHP